MRLNLYVIPVYKDVVKSKLHDEVDQRLLHARGRSCVLRSITRLAAEEADREWRLSIRHRVSFVESCVVGSEVTVEGY